MIAEGIMGFGSQGQVLLKGLELLARFFVDASSKLAAHIGIMSALAAVLSAFMSNVAALALLMPLEILIVAVAIPMIV